MRPRKAILRLARIVVVTLLLLALAVGVFLPLYGRVRLTRATGELEALLGEKLVFDLASLETPPLPPYENSTEWLLDGTAAIDLSEMELERRNEATKIALSEWSAELEDSVRSMLEKNRLALETLHAAADIGRSDYGIKYRDGSQAQIPNLLSILQAAKLLHLEGRLAFADGDVAGGHAAAKALAEMATSLDQEHFLILPLIGIACERFLLRLLAEMLETTEPWAASPTLLSQLETLIPTADRAAKTRELLALEGVLWSLRGARDDWGEASWSPPWGISHYLFGHWQAADMLLGCRKTIARITVPFGEDSERFGISAEVVPGLGQRLIDVVKRNPWLEGMVKSVEEHLNLGELSSETLSNVATRFQRIAGERQVLRAAFALRRHGIALGSYPQERPDIAELIRPDPYSGRLVVYRRGDDGSLDLELDGAAKLWAESREGRRLGPGWQEDGRLRWSSADAYVREGTFGVKLPTPPEGGRASEETPVAMANPDPFKERIVVGSLGNGAQRLVEAMAAMQDPFDLVFLLSAFPGIDATLPTDTGRQVAGRLIESLTVRQDLAELNALSHGLKTLMRVVPAELAREIEQRITDTMAAVCIPAQLPGLFRIPGVAHLAPWGDVEQRPACAEDPAPRAFAEPSPVDAAGAADRFVEAVNTAAESLLELPPHGLRALAAELSPGAVTHTADRLVESMAVDQEGYELRIRAQGLRELGSRLSDAAAARAADRLVEAMGETPDTERWSLLIGGLRELGQKLPAGSATRAARRLLEEMEPALRLRSWEAHWRLRVLADGLQTLRYKIPEHVFGDAVTRIVENVTAGQGPPCHVAKSFLSALVEQLDAPGAASLAGTIVDALDVTREPAPLSCLAELLGTLGEEPPADAVEQATGRIVKAMSAASGDEMGFLVYGFRELSSKLPSATADRAAERILEAMGNMREPPRSRPRQPERLRCLAQTLGALGEKLSDPVAEESLAAVVSAPASTRHGYYDVDCESLCAAAVTLLRRDNLQPIVELVRRSGCASDRGGLVEAVGELVGASFGTAGDSRQKRLEAFFQWAESEGYLPNSSSSPSPLTSRRSPPPNLEVPASDALKNTSVSAVTC